MVETRMLLALLVALVLPPARDAGAAVVAGVAFDARHEWNGTPLRLHGAGVLRTRVFIKAYAAALYLGEGVAADRALEDVPRRLEIEYFWAIPAPLFARATREGIARNADAATLARLRDPIERLNALYEDVEPGDRYSLTYVPGVGTELARNGAPLGRIEGAEFSRALFAIWIGEDALDASLREALLARR